MPGVQRGRATTDTFDPHFGWETQEAKAARIQGDKEYAAQNEFRSNANNKVNYSMSLTDPATGFQKRYDPSSGGAGGGSGSGGAGAKGPGQPLSIADVQQFLPVPVPRTPMPAQVPHPPAADRSASEAAAYGRAKDQIGASTGGAIKALQRQFQSRGISGSGLEGAAIGNQIGRGAGQLGDVSRDQAIEGLKRDYAETDRNYAGDISQRSGDMGYQSTERGQDISQEQGRVSQIPALLSLIMRNRTGAAY